MGVHSVPLTLSRTPAIITPRITSLQPHRAVLSPTRPIGIG